jgi:hypothetical protein
LTRAGDERDSPGTEPEVKSPGLGHVSGQPGGKARAGFLWKNLEPSERWGHRLTSVGLIVAVAGFAGLAFQLAQARDQLAQARDQLAASTWATMSSQLLDFDKAVLEEPEAAEYFGGGKRPGNPRLRRRARQLAVMQLDLWDAWNASERYVPDDLLDREAVDRWKNDLFSRSRLLCQVLAEDQPGYPQWFVQNGYLRCGANWPASVPPP